MTEIHYIMPMAGRGSRFREKGFEFPKPLLEIYDKPFFFWATQSVRKFVHLASLEYVVLQEHIDKYQIDREILKLFPEANIHILPDVTEGAVITCLKGIENISDNLPVVFNDCDHLFKSTAFNTFCNAQDNDGIAGILLTFHSRDAKYSFIGKDAKGNVSMTAEKRVLSDEAVCGCYYFSQADVFRNAAQTYIQNCEYQEYFMSGVYNVLIHEKQCVKCMKTDFHVPFGMPEEYEEARVSECYKELL